MTKRDLVLWIEAHGCFVIQLPEGRARSVKYYNPKTGKHAFVDTPIDDEYEMKAFTIFRICSILGIGCPDCAAAMKSLHDHIEETHLKDKRR